VHQSQDIRSNQADTTSYEIHRRTNSGWEFWAMRGKAEEAIAEAKKVLRQSGTEAVRVVGDTYDPATGMSTPSTLFRASAASAQDGAIGSHWLQRLTSVVQNKPAGERGLAARVTMGVAAIGIGTALTWFRS
jgi:hypothetical protein